jgi:hypothetical protein
MRPADGLHVEWIEDEAVVLDTATEQFHYLNPPAALLYALILEHGFEHGLEELRRIYGGERDIHEDVTQCLESLAERGILVGG